MKDLIPQLIDIIQRAGEEVLKVYEGEDIGLEIKGDDTPLTEADRRANAVITEGLEEFTPDIPVISEENKSVPYDERKGWERFWLVDPLDGTKEFVKRNGEFTLNIALIEGSEAVLGIVGIPVKGLIYYGSREGAFEMTPGGDLSGISIEGKAGRPNTIAAVSRSHFSEKTKDVIDDLAAETISAGSSLKFVLVAKGEADLYPRLGPTHEWDTAAGHAIAEAAGAVVCGLDGSPLVYNKEVPKHEGFLVCSPEIKEKAISAIARAIKHV